MWFLKLLVILAFPNACATVRDHRYTNTWAVQIDGDVNEAKRITEKYGFTFKMKVFHCIKDSLSKILIGGFKGGT